MDGIESHNGESDAQGVVTGSLVSYGMQESCDSDDGMIEQGGNEEQEVAMEQPRQELSNKRPADEEEPAVKPKLEQPEQPAKKPKLEGHVHKAKVEGNSGDSDDEFAAQLLEGTE